MKTLKRLVTGLLLVAVLATVGLLTGCGGDGQALTGTMKIVLAPSGNAEVTVIDVDLKDFTDKDSVMDVIDAYTENGKLCYKGEKGVYGIMLSALGVQEDTEYNGQPSKYNNYILNPSGNQYIAVLTSVEKDKTEVEEGASWQPLTAEYEGVTVVYAMVGVSSMTICDGAVVYFTIDTF